MIQFNITELKWRSFSCLNYFDNKNLTSTYLPKPLQFLFLMCKSEHPKGAKNTFCGLGILNRFGFLRNDFKIY
jgi:hypothetical protein